MSSPRLLILLALAAAAPDARGGELATELTARSSFAAEHGKALTGDASPVDPGVMETEVAYAPLWSGAVLGGGGGASTHAVTLTATYGVVPDVDVMLAGGFASAYDGTRLDDAMAPQGGAGLADLVVGARWRFANVSRHALELAVTAGAVVPVGSAGSPTDLAISQGYWSGRLAVVATKDFGRLTMNGEVACSAPIAGDAGGLLALGQVNVAGGYHVNPWLQPELELNYQVSLGQDQHVIAVTAGLVVPWGAGHRVVAALQQSIVTWNSPATTGGVFAYKRAL